MVRGPPEGHGCKCLPEDQRRGGDATPIVAPFLDRCDAAEGPLRGTAAPPTGGLVLLEGSEGGSSTERQHGLPTACGGPRGVQRRQCRGCGAASGHCARCQGPSGGGWQGPWQGPPLGAWDGMGLWAPAIEWGSGAVSMREPWSCVGRSARLKKKADRGTTMEIGTAMAMPTSLSPMRTKVSAALRADVHLRAGG